MGYKMQEAILLLNSWYDVVHQSNREGFDDVIAKYYLCSFVQEFAID